MRDTIDMAREAGFPLMSFEGVTYVSPELERLVALVRADEREETNRRANASWSLMCEKMVAAEREACAKVCDELADKHGWEGSYANECAIAIRARGNT
jgi:hypothetical protein